MLAFRLPAPFFFVLRRRTASRERSEMIVERTADLGYPHHIDDGVDFLARAIAPASRIILFMDYGGTLVPDISGPGLAPPRPVLKRLRQLARTESIETYVMSGRTVAELSGLLNVPGVGLIGQRGLEMRSPGGPVYHPLDPNASGGLVHHLELDAHRRLGVDESVVIENRGFSIVLRSAARDARVPDATIESFVSLVREVDSMKTLEVLYGDGTVEARLSGWSTSDAIRSILDDEDPEETLAICVGDHVADESCFEVVDEWSRGGDDESPWYIADEDDDEEEPPRAVTILVSPRPRPTFASLFLRDPDEVHEFISALASVTSALL